MTTTVPRTPVRAPTRDRRPEQWLRATACAGWAALVVLSVAGAHHAGGPPGADAAAWAAMVAVMAPLAAPSVRYAAARSPGGARRAVAADVAVGWALVWAGAAAVLALGTSALVGTAGPPAALAVVAGVAVAWQWTPVKRRGLARCDRRLAPSLERRRGRRQARRAGVALGRDCVTSCWPLMALMGAAGHSVPVSAACVGIAWYERRRPHHDPATRPTSLAIAAVGGAALVGVLVS